MTNIELVREKLKQLIEQDIDPVYFPIKKGNKINIGSYSVAQTRDGYSVKDYKTNTIIALTFSKTAAVAIAKNLSKRKDIIDKVMELDKVIQKNTIDCEFYRHTMKVTDNPVRYQSTCNRYDVSLQRTKDAKEKLQKFIL